MTRILQTRRGQARFRGLESMVRDIGIGFRYFRHNRGFFAVAVVILAVGIGATTVVFSVAETLLLRPLSYPESDRLVTLRNVSILSDYPSTRVAPGVLADWQIKATSFEAIAGYRWATVDVIDGAQSDRLSGLLATPEFFDVFGVPLLGRAFRAAEDRGARRPFESTDTGEAVVLGNEVWRRLFAADEGLLGSSVDLQVLNFSRVGPTNYTVVGVAMAPVRFPPVEADFQLGDSNVVDTIDFWMPQFVSVTELPGPGGRESWFDVVARLRPGVTIGQAQAEMDGIARVQAEQYPEPTDGREIRVVPLREHIAGESRNPILLMSVGTAMLLLIACSNVATLLLARGVARRREVAVRTALGAPMWKIVRQFLTEALILSACAGLLGVLLAAWAINLARPWMPQSLPLLQEMGVNPTVLVFALTSVVFTACITGLAPAFRSVRADGPWLTSLDGRGVTRRRLHSRLVGVLVSAEVALTLVLLVGAGLLVRSALRASQVETGFNPENLLTMIISLPANKFDWDHNAVFAREVTEAVRSLSSISDAAVVLGVPMRVGNYTSGLGMIEGYVPANDEELLGDTRVVSPSYFATMQIPIVVGRSLEARDSEGERGAAAPNILVSEAFAERYWPGQDPLGKRMTFGGAWSAVTMTVVGVAGDVRYSGLETGPTNDIYLPQGLFPQAAITLIARTRTGDPLVEASAVRERIRAVDEHAFVTDIRSIDHVIAGSQAERRAGTVLVSAFGAVALLLVMAGVYSVITQAVVERRRDLAIRSALGAGPRRVVATAMRTALQPAAVGVALGALAALGVTRVMTSLLFEVTALDIVTWAGACATLLAACLAAGSLSGRRAARIDPMAVLRSE